MTKFTVRIQGNGHEFNIFARARSEAEAIEKTTASVLTAKKYEKIRTDPKFSVFTVA